MLPARSFAVTALEGRRFDEEIGLEVLTLDYLGRHTKPFFLSVFLPYHPLDLAIFVPRLR
jgi:hypothetical protein